MENEVITIHKKAQEIRRRAIEAYGEKDFARMIMGYDSQIPLDLHLPERIAWAISLIADQGTSQTSQKNRELIEIAIVWLDGAGRGAVSLASLNTEVQLIRDKLMKLEQLTPEEPG